MRQFNRVPCIVFVWLAISLALLPSIARPLTRDDQQRLDELARRILSHKDQVAGYPVNQETDLDGFYAWYTRLGLQRSVMNNVGDPRKTSPYSLNTHAFENEVIDDFAELYGFQPGKYWGFVTASGTDGNSHGIYFGRKALASKAQQAPILYVSEEAHYSIKKLADVQNLELRLIKALEMGQMDIRDFERQLDPERPALVVVAMGTTFKGAIDDQAAIRRVLTTRHRGPHYIHLDAALFGGFLPYASGDGWQLVHQQIQRFDSIAVSGHKFFGFDEPMGIFITTQDTFRRLNPFHVPYLNDAVPTISCSRSAISPLKFWWKLHATPLSALRQQANEMLDGAETLLARLRETGIRAWKNPYSNTVFFERPDAGVMRDYDLAPEEDPAFGKVAHFVVMPHVDAVLAPFVADMKRWKARTSSPASTTLSPRATPRTAR